ncbi:MAG: hypothetical protein IT168_03025 [Bryobacterales bacterium]|nr:hypothetical protein [Bryobacterales bacterium]
MEYLVGLVVAVLVYGFARLTRFDRDRAFYATVLVVVAHYYILFAVMAGSARAIVVESVAAGVFVALAVAGFKRSMWIVAAGLAGHGVFDLVHRLLIANPGVPVYWPGFCLSFDVLAGALVAFLPAKR